MADEETQTIAVDEDLSNLDVVIGLAQRAADPGVPERLYKLLSDPYTLLYGLFEGHSQLQLLREKLGMSPLTTLTAAHLIMSELVTAFGGKMPPPPVREKPPADSACSSLDTDPNAEGADICSHRPWRRLSTLLTAFRAAMCGMPVPPVKLTQWPAGGCVLQPYKYSWRHLACTNCLLQLSNSKEGLFLNALLALHVGALGLVLDWWELQEEKGCIAIPDEILTMLLFSAHTFSSVPPVERLFDIQANRVFYDGISSHLPAVISLISKQALAHAAPGTHPSKQAVGSAAAGSSGPSARGARGGGQGGGRKGRRAGKSSTQGVEPQPGVSDQEASAMPQPHPAQQPHGSATTMGHVDGQSDNACQARFLLAARGILYGCWHAIHRGQEAAVNARTYLIGTRLLGTFLDIAQLLQSLHLANPAPITDPCPALRLPASTSTSTPPRGRRGTHSSRGSHTRAGSHRSQDQQQDLYQAPLQYQRSPVWIPDTYSLGPAPMLLAGAECIQACMSCSPKLSPSSQELLAAIKLTGLMTKLAHAMVIEVEGTQFGDRMQRDAGAFESWCGTCAALCATAVNQLQTIAYVANYHVWRSDLKQAVVVRRLGPVRDGSQEPATATLQHVQQQPAEPGQAGDAQDRANQEQQQQQPAGPVQAVYAESGVQQEQQGRVHSAADPSRRVEIRLDEQVIALLPVMAAAALQLGYAALTCVRLMNTKVFNGVMPVKAPSLGHTRPAVSAIQAVKHAVWLHTLLTRIAAGVGTTDSPDAGARAAAAPRQTATAATSQPAGAPVGIATAAAAAAAAAAERGDSHQPHECVVRVDELMPPGFQRHCAAVAAWGPNVATMTDLARTAVATLHAPEMLGSGDKLLSWEPGADRAGDLIGPAVKLVEAAVALLVRTDGDLAGWLGDLAPRGDLDSTQLLFRIFGVNVADLDHPRRGPSGADTATSQAATHLTSHGLPLLSLAFRMLNPAASAAAARSSEGGVEGAAQGNNSAKGTGVGAGRAGAGSKDADKARTSQDISDSGSGSGMQQQPGRSGSSNTASGGRVGLSFVQAWTQSPLTVKMLALACQSLQETDNHVAQMLEAIVARATMYPDCDNPPLELAMPAGLDLTTLSLTMSEAQQLEKVQQILIERGQSESEPLFKMIVKERNIWGDALYSAPTYRPKEAAQHSQRLQAYVEAAAARAAGQLEPGLKKELYQALGLAPS